MFFSRRNFFNIYIYIDPYIQYKYLEFLFYTFYIVVSQDAPAITFVSLKQIKNIGGTVDLKCTTTNARDFPIRWVKVEAVDNIYISSGSALIIPDNRYSVTYDYTSSSITLRVWIN